MYRDHTKEVQIGNVTIGGGNPIRIQSMTNTKTEDVEATVAQILALEKAGCEIIRCAVPNMDAAKAIGEIKKQIHIPLVADIHFDYKLAIAAIENGADKIRINPGNIGDEQRVRAVVEKAKEYYKDIMNDLSNDPENRKYPFHEDDAVTFGEDITKLEGLVSRIAAYEKNVAAGNYQTAEEADAEVDPANSPKGFSTCPP